MTKIYHLLDIIGNPEISVLDKEIVYVDGVYLHMDIVFSHDFNIWKVRCIKNIQTGEWEGAESDFAFTAVRVQAVTSSYIEYIPVDDEDEITVQ